MMKPITDYILANVPHFANKWAPGSPPPELIQGVWVGGGRIDVTPGWMIGWSNPDDDGLARSTTVIYQLKTAQSLPDEALVALAEMFDIDAFARVHLRNAGPDFKKVVELIGADALDEETQRWAEYGISMMVQPVGFSRKTSSIRGLLSNTSGWVTYRVAYAGGQYQVQFSRPQNYSATPTANLLEHMLALINAETTQRPPSGTPPVFHMASVRRS